jgi:putative flippase GtrA
MAGILSALHRPGPARMKLAAVFPQLSRYSLVSAFSLALDFAIYLALTEGQVHAALAGVVGYAAGLALHFLLSVRFVFDAGATDKQQPRLLAEFAASGIAGMGVTALVISATTGFGAPALAAKVVAAAASFLIVYTLRRTVVFAAQ